MAAISRTVFLQKEIDQLPKLIAGGSLGTLTSKGRIEAALKREGEG
jgi:hypothetical protein